MFGFDSLVYGVCGDDIAEEDLEGFGVDWEGLEDERLLQSRELNNSEPEDDTWSSRGVPERLNTVQVESPTSPFSHDDTLFVDRAVSPWDGLTDDISMKQRWSTGLAVAHTRNPHLFL
jgi:hypothetical protein